MANDEDEDKPIGKRQPGESAKDALKRNAERQQRDKAKQAIEKVRNKRRK